MNDNALGFKRWRTGDFHPGTLKKNAGTTSYHPFRHCFLYRVSAEALGVESLQIVTSPEQVLLVLCTFSFTSWKFFLGMLNSRTLEGEADFFYELIVPLSILAEMKSSSKIVKLERGKTDFC